MSLVTVVAKDSGSSAGGVRTASSSTEAFADSERDSHRLSDNGDLESQERGGCWMGDRNSMRSHDTMTEMGPVCGNVLEK